jgi:hypothetical protein
MLVMNVEGVNLALTSQRLKFCNEICWVDPKAKVSGNSVELNSDPEPQRLPVHAETRTQLLKLLSATEKLYGYTSCKVAAQDVRVKLLP